MIGDNEAIKLNIAIINQAKADYKSACKTLIKCEKAYLTYLLALKSKEEVLDFFNSKEFASYTLGAFEPEVLIDLLDKEVKEWQKRDIQT